jgi:hypothetical protein
MINSGCGLRKPCRVVGKFICWAIWKARNKLCFEKKPIKGPVEIMFSDCALMKYWVGLYPEDAQKMINAGVETMLARL